MRLWLVLLFVYSLVWPAFAQTQLFVRNQPFQGDVRNLAGELYAPLDEMLEAFGINWSLYPDGYLWLSLDEKRQAGKPPLREVHRLLLEGRPVQVSQQMYANRVYVSVEQLAYALGAPFRKNATYSTADVLSPVLVASSLEGTQSGPGVLSLEQLHYTTVPGPPERLVGYLTIRNKDTQAVRSLTIRLSIRTEKGLLGRMALRVGRLEGGAAYTWQFPGWLNLRDPGAALKLRADWDYLR